MALAGGALAAVAVIATIVTILLNGDGDDDDGGDDAGRNTVTPTVTQGGSAAVQALPRSAQPLADDVIVWGVERDGQRDLQAVDTTDDTRTWVTSSPDDDLFALVSQDRRTVVYEHEVSRPPTTCASSAPTAPATGGCSRPCRRAART